MKRHPSDLPPRSRLRGGCLFGLAGALLLALPLWAEGSGEVPKRTVIKSIRHIMVEDLRPSLDLLDVDYAIRADQNAVILRGYDDAGLPTALKVIEALDSPSPTLEVQAFILAASREEKEGLPVVKELEPVVATLKELFGYRSIHQMDSVFLRVLEGHPGQIMGSVDLGKGERATYRMSFRQVRVSPREDGPVFIRLAGLEFDLANPGGERPAASLRTDVEILAGQKAVVGKSTPDGSDESLVLVLETEIQ